MASPAPLAAPELDTDVVARHALAHDASPYLLIPEAVAVPADEGQVIALLRQARASGRPLTFRAGGTSLSGQAQSAAVLADVRRHFRQVEVLDAGRRVRVGPGVTIRQVNAHLARHGRRLGPDPASESACTIGGMIANNSSGMAAGTRENTYATLESLRCVLPSGTVLDTSRPDADAALRAAEPDLVAGLERLIRRVREDPEAVRVIRERFALKNTMGYGINALLDFDSPADCLAHLVIGSEGTLAFISSAVLRTVAVPAQAATGLLVLPGLQEATAPLPEIVAAGFATVELLDARSLQVAQRLPGAPGEIAGLDIGSHAALLLEVRADDPDALAAQVSAAQSLAAGLRGAAPFAMTTDAARRAALWTTRKGLYAAVAGARPAGSTALLEDVVVPVDRLAGTCRGLQHLFARHGYDGAVIFGHAKDGNLHFLLDEHLGAASSRLEAFTEDMVDLVLDQGGNLKAEHGTGRAMAPFVERQYGTALHAVMREIKQLVDPAGILNPGVVLTAEAGAHLRDLQPVVGIEEEADRCVECGYCEPVCPSRDLTLTPRQRIVLRRDAALAEQRGDRETARAIRAAYDYLGLQTCAADGMCQTACPVGIDTGDLVRRLRAQDAEAGAGGAAQRALWGAAARHWGPTTAAASAALDIAGALPAALPRAAARVGRALLGSDAVPDYRPELPTRGGSVRRGGGRGRTGAEVSAVYLPSCVHTMFGAAGEGIGAGPALSRLAERAGVRLAVPDAAADLCCGTPFSSKGMRAAKETMRSRLRAALEEAAPPEAHPAGPSGTVPEAAPTPAEAADRRLPVVVDAASCTEGLFDAVAGTGLEVLDAVTYARRHLLPRLEVRRPIASVTVHPTCSTTRLGATDDLVAIAQACAEEVVVPIAWGCCAYAGDRGMLHPELTASATAAEAAEVATRETDWYVSANRTCELGMQAATGRTYRHVLELLEHATS